MTIELRNYSIREIIEGYKDNCEDGVVGFNGKLDIRPSYQREFVYKDDKRNAVMDTILKGYPLNVMYWAKTTEGFEVMDGQQRTISFCQYVNGDYSIEYMGNTYAFFNLPNDIKEQILNYNLMVYVCDGTESEKLAWFKTINIQGEKLTEQELRNAVYTGRWLSDAKRYFSKRGCVAYMIGSSLLNGKCNRQDYLETVLEWIGNRDGLTIEEYMSKHQNDYEASELVSYFRSVIDWVTSLFGERTSNGGVTYRKEMKGIDWGILYNRYHNEQKDPSEVKELVSRLMADSDVTNKKGIYRYVFDHNEKWLSVRLFDDNMKRESYERQGGICPICGKHFTIEGMEADHITPWSQGGRTVAENCQMLCRECNRRKSDR